MASGFKDNKGWIASFRGADGNRKRVRIPDGCVETKEEADAYAQECERYVKRIGKAIAPDLDDIDHALKLKAISEKHADDYRKSAPITSAARPESLTIEDAWERHPSTLREGTTDGKAYTRHLKHLREFCEFYSVTKLKDVTLAMVQDWILRKRVAGVSFDGRRHMVLSIKRACQMGATAGLPNPVAGFRLDYRERSKGIDAWSLKEIAQAARVFADQFDNRALSALGMGALMGLRPSEIIRARVIDVEGDLLHIGREEAKNDASVRSLVIPPAMLPWIRAQIKGKKALEPIVAPAQRRTKKRIESYDPDSFRAWFRPNMAAASGRDLYPKALRKTFATWTLDAGIDTVWIERYLGHTLSGLSRVTSKHYLGKADLNNMRKAAEQISEAFTSALSTPK